jgi:hypothetical protein
MQVRILPLAYIGGENESTGLHEVLSYNFAYLRAVISWVVGTGFIFYSQFLYNWQGIRDMCLLYTVIVFLDGLAFTGALLGVIGAKSFEPEERKARAKVVPFK